MARILLGDHRWHRGVQGLRAASGCSSARATRCCRCSRPARSGSSPPRRSSRWRGSRRPSDPYPHLERADALVVAPLTANTLAKLAHGLADNVLTEAALAHRGPLVLAPAMNTRMWEHPATQANLALLRERGAIVVGPGEGELAEGEVGAGRMAEPSRDRGRAWSEALVRAA